METADAARRWAEEWQRAWTEHDPDRVAALYAQDATFRTSPFREPQDPRAYSEWAFSEEDSAEVRFGDPVAVGGDRAVGEWWTVARAGEEGGRTLQVPSSSPPLRLFPARGKRDR